MIKLNKKFYNIEAVKESLTDFKEVCSGSIKNKRDSIEINLKPKKRIKKELLKREFCNYVLGLMKNKGVV